ncbi:hypothetical protein P4H61_02215 [Paenibacillus peoriae]|uniref:hypothetical protein n=1 Tax=Paenibacillus peoriae TaxID=59893 RepID=UPI00026C59A4|nr:hypothetical protein [Paenibacillus peoriae]MEC0180315.1 hypothetical protein [Paenibacillus peoriae]
MDWYKEKDLFVNGIEGFDEDESVDFYIKKIECSVAPDFIQLKEDIIIQWIIAPFILEKDGLIYDLSVLSKEEDFILSNIAPFFDTVKGIYEDEKLITIRLSDLKEEVTLKCENILFHPIVQDFYFNENEISQNSIQTKNYEIIIDNFLEKHKNSDSGTDSKLWDFLKKTQTSEEGCVIISPNNWLFNQSLQVSPALRYFAECAKEIMLTVNTNNLHVRAIELK